MSYGMSLQDICLALRLENGKVVFAFTIDGKARILKVYTAELSGFLSETSKVALRTRLHVSHAFSMENDRVLAVIADVIMSSS